MQFQIATTKQCDRGLSKPTVEATLLLSPVCFLPPRFLGGVASVTSLAYETGWKRAIRCPATHQDEDERKKGTKTCIAGFLLHWFGCCETLLPWSPIHRLPTSAPENNFIGFVIGCQTCFFGSQQVFPLGNTLFSVPQRGTCRSAKLISMSLKRTRFLFFLCFFRAGS